MSVVVAIWHLSSWVITVPPLPSYELVESKGSVLLIFMFTSILLSRTTDWLTPTHWMNHLLDKYILSVNEAEKKDCHQTGIWNWELVLKLVGPLHTHEDSYYQKTKTINQKLKTVSSQRYGEIGTLVQNQIGTMWIAFSKTHPMLKVLVLPSAC